MKRISIKWNIVNPIECSGVATIDEWDEGQSFIDMPATRTEIPVKVSKGITSMKDVPHRIHKELGEEVASMMRIFFAGASQNDITYKWLDMPEE